MSRYVDIHTHHPTFRHIEPQAVGVHPWRAAEQHFNELQIEGAIAIGEIGLDYACKVDRVVQERVLREQLAVAERRDLPVVLHCVRAFEPMMKILSEYDLRAVIFHGFIGSVQQAERAVSRGYYLSFGVGAFRSPKTHEALRLMPLDRLFVETDESEVGIENVYERVAQTRGVELEELKYKLEENYKKIFDIK